MIGGIDIIIDTDFDVESQLREIKNVIACHWPEAVYEFDCKEDSRIEFFVYENEYWLGRWNSWSEKDVDDPHNFNRMLYFILENDRLTVVIDAWEGQAETILEQLVDILHEQ